jgi:hypothetical protein
VFRDGPEMAEFRGNELVVKAPCGTLEDLECLCDTLYYGIPLLLNVDFGDSPVIDRVYGTVGDVPFRWELVRWDFELDVTNQEHQEAKATAAWRRLEHIAPLENRRLLGALHYFQVACRLSRAGQTPWEFMSEILLNLSKTLEVLFPPPPGDPHTIDAARRGLGTLGYSPEEIERDFVPSMALRSTIGSAHVGLALFTPRQLRVLHRYTERAERAFRELLQRVLGRVEEGLSTLTPYLDPAPSNEAQRVIQRLAEALGEE